MKAWAVVAPSAPLEEIELPTPEPQGTEVLIEVTHCGVCHSDLHFWKGEYNMGGGKIMKIADRGVTLPRAPGHEIAGRVTAVGSDAIGVKVGDIRVVYPWIGCGHCAACAEEQDNMCLQQRSLGVVQHGGFASHVLVPHARYLVDPGLVDVAVAATYACSGITAYSAIRKAGPFIADQAIAVIGAGGVGLTTIAMLRALGQNSIIAIDVSAASRAAALEAGATAAFDSGATDVVAEVLASCGPAQAVFDHVGISPTATLGMNLLAKGGRLVVVGVSGGDLALSLATMVFRAYSVIGTNTGTPQDLRDVMAMANDGKMISPPVCCRSKSEANQALLDLKLGDVTGRQVLTG